MTTRRVVAAVAAVLTLSACGSGGQSETGHPTDGATGAASPASTPDYSATPQAGTSTGAVAAPAGGPAMAGDTMGARGAAAGASTSAAPAGGARPARP